MNLTFSLDEVKELVSKEEGYEAIHAMHQLARAYGVRVEELDELIKEGSLKRSLQTIICGTKEEQMGAVVKIVRGQESEQERLNGISHLRLNHLFRRLVQALKNELEDEFEEAINRVINYFAIAREYCQERGFDEAEATIGLVINTLNEVSFREFKEIHYQIWEMIDLNESLSSDRELHNYLEDEAWFLMFDLKHCVDYLESVA